MQLAKHWTLFSELPCPQSTESLGQDSRVEDQLTGSMRKSMEIMANKSFPKVESAEKDQRLLNTSTSISKQSSAWGDDSSH